ncbi:uncharacterized protein MICPUCDRAFT_60852 [Micromonas pusilla CCMP1545]|uniref:Complex III subunit 9 n=1 Tax=Micromonas pusilla (strain CCMP1545) TaxID=564608 RepID=C1MZU1_MICPC|nr:uncharacterized protein MICPUCDRAFT_60852 [Micromonas pusilla CCMP1545]EEH54929.1 predicted protein [Micromonas pusilla CCMP1545]|eukprot:XP_003061279.1 predicted protein [Micromonas pusilla CCMP1545]
MQSLPSPEDARFGHPLTLRRPPHLLPPQRSSVYVGVIVAGALVGEKVVNQGFDSMWASNNKGKLYAHIVDSFPEPESDE